MISARLTLNGSTRPANELPKSRPPGRNRRMPRTDGALGANLRVIGVTAALLAASWLSHAPRQALQRSLCELAATVEAHDVGGGLGSLGPSPGPRLRKADEPLIPLVRVERARI